MSEVRIPELLTPDIIKALSDNVETLKTAFSAEEERCVAYGGKDGCHKEDDDCCCPKFLKFKFILCSVVIINKNAECEDD